MRPEPVVVRNPAELAERAASWIAAALAEAVAARGRCALALTGGNTPRPVYRRLAELPGIPWHAVAVYFGDERAVPPDHPESNYRLANQALLSRVAVPPVQIHRMEAERPDLAQAAGEYEALLPDPLDLLLLGIGADGHTASLFPHAATLSTQRRVVPAVGGFPPRARLTVTPPVIAQARRLLVMAAGADKALAVAAALDEAGSPDAVPARLARHGTWILDRAAAAALPEPSR